MRTSRWFLPAGLTLLLALISIPTASVHAQEFDCLVDISTGYDQDASAVPPGGSEDDDYEVDDGFGFVPALTGGAEQGFPVPPWVANSEASTWISNVPNSVAEPGIYTYRVTFLAPDGVDPADLVISGSWTADDSVTGVTVNGLPTGITFSNFGALSPTPRNAGRGLFQAGENTIEFTVTNGAEAANPSGLRVEACVGVTSSSIQCLATVSTGYDQVAELALLDGEEDDDWTVDVGFGPEPTLIGSGATGFPIPPWIANDGASTWISSTANAVADPGIYTYAITFDIPVGVDAAKAVLSGFWAADDAVPTVTINGFPAGFGGGGFGSWTPLPATAGLGLFQEGENTIEIQLENGGVDPNPAGLRIEACVGIPEVEIRDLNLSTGVDSLTGSTLGDGEAEPRWTLQLEGADLPAIALAVPPCPIPPWFPNSVNARWIGPDTADCQAETGIYSYSLELTLPDDFGAEDAILSGGITADDQVLDILVNGNSTGFTAVGFDQLTTFPVNLGRGLLVEGPNTITVEVSNGGDAANPGGLYVDGEIVIGPPLVDAPASLFSLDTGFDNETSAVIGNGLSDDNYVITGPAGSSIGPELATIVPDDAFPIGPWLGTTPRSKWIGVNAPGTSGPPGDYTFTVKVTLPDSVDAAAARILGGWTSDNLASDIRINGVSTGIGNTGNFPVLEGFPADAGLGLFQTGENLVEFIVNNAGDSVNPIGLRVEAVVGTGQIDPRDLSTAISDRGIGPLPAGATDPGWTITLADNPDQTDLPAVSVDGASLPAGALENSNSSGWLGLDASASPGADGTWHFTKTFNLPADLNPARTVITGGWAVEGSGIEVTLNGTPTGLTSSGTGALTALPANFGEGLLLPGANVLTLIATTDRPLFRLEARLEPLPVSASALDISTGVDQTLGELLADDAADEDYTVAPLGLDPEEARVLAVGAAPIPPWLADPPTSRWISVLGTDSNGLPGEYRYRVEVLLTAEQAASAHIVGAWAADDQGLDVLINDISTGFQTTGGFAALTPFPAEAGLGLFLEGFNTIEFVVVNGGEASNPTGLRVDAFIQAPVVSEGPVFKRGDVDANGMLEITDPINSLSFQFLGTFDPVCMDALDFDDNGKVEITDPVANLSHQFLGTAPPPAPGKEQCGVDPTDGDDLGCEDYPDTSCDG